jgi:hypothetical protein
VLLPIPADPVGGTGDALGPLASLGVVSVQGVPDGQGSGAGAEDDSVLGSSIFGAIEDGRKALGR